MFRREFLTSDRNIDLYENFKRVISGMDHIVLDEALALTVNSPAKRFYISADRAYGVIVRWDKYGPSKLISDERQEMYEELYRIIVQLRASKPDMPLQHLIEIAIEQPAPKFYLKINSAKIILCNFKKAKSLLAHL